MSKFQKKISSEPDHTQHFQTDHLKADLKGRSVRGGAVTMVSQGCKFVLQMGSTVVLARLLSPQDYGLIGMVTSVTGIVFLFNDMGLSTATIQRAEINHKQVSTLFWVNVGLSVLLMLLTAVMAPAIAWFYGEPRLTWIAIVSASAFIFGGLSVQHQALLRRQMRFTALAAIEIFSIVLGVAIAIISALYGAGYWSLVFMSLTTAISTAVGVWVMCGWRPGLPAQRSGVRSMLAFDGNLTGFSVLNYCARNLDNILIGRVWGAEAPGVYAKADLQQLIQELDVGNVVNLLGWKHQEEVVKILNHSQIFVDPCVTSKDNNQEGIAHGLKEAIAMGLPVVSTYHSDSLS